MSSAHPGGWGHRAGLWLPPLLGFAVSFYLSSRPGRDVPSLAPDYIVHAIEYALLGFLAIRALNGGIAPLPTGRTFLLAVTLCALWAIGDEYHQSLVPGRAAELSDLLSDGAGLLLACGVFVLLARRRIPVPGGAGSA